MDPPVRLHSFMEIGHEIMSTAILFLPLIQIVELSIIGERLCTKGPFTQTRCDNALIQ